MYTFLKGGGMNPPKPPLATPLASWLSGSLSEVVLI